MASERIINVQGYYVGETRINFPHSPAFFFVYSGTYNTEDRTCTLRSLLYVGQSEDLWTSNNETDFWNMLASTLLPGESIFYAVAFTNLNNAERLLIHKALVYELRPILNQTADTTRPEKMTIIVEGNRHAFVPTRIETPSY